MSTELTGKKIRIRPGNQNMHPATQKTINEKTPLGNVLGFIQKQMRELSVNFISRRKHIIKIRPC